MPHPVSVSSKSLSHQVISPAYIHSKHSPYDRPGVDLEMPHIEMHIHCRSFGILCRDRYVSVRDNSD